MKLAKGRCHFYFNFFKFIEVVCTIMSIPELGCFFICFEFFRDFLRSSWHCNTSVHLLSYATYTSSPLTLPLFPRRKSAFEFNASSTSSLVTLCFVSIFDLILSIQMISFNHMIGTYHEILRFIYLVFIPVKQTQPAA